MKHKRILALTAFAIAVAIEPFAQGAITIPGADGSDGVLSITTNTVIDLSQAVTANWDANNSANAGRGVYDPAKWAVVFKYSSLTIAANATVTFRNHPSRAPVVWLVSGSATIAGSITLNGQDRQGELSLAEPGPGGFRGGAGIFRGVVGGSAGFGIGGGSVNNNNGGDPSLGFGGSYGTVGSGGPSTYGNPSLNPLIGGSGGGGNSMNTHNGGGAGGGALLLACANTLSLSGTIVADGGKGDESGDSRISAGGSGGGIRVVAGTLAGNGTLQAVGGASLRPGGLGRIRVERAINTASLKVVPDPSVVDLAQGATGLIWPPTGAPEVRVVSIGGVIASTDPRAEFGTIGADTVLPLTNSTQVVIETTNVEQASEVKVRGTPRSNGNYTEVNAAVQTLVSANPPIIRWVATLPVNVGYSAVQVKVIRP